MPFLFLFSFCSLWRSDVEEGGETVFPYADVNISSVPWWNELSECAKQGLSLKPKRAMHCFSGAQDLMPSDASSLHG
jgi:prolyl 4-hydroxylase